MTLERNEPYSWMLKLTSPPVNVGVELSGGWNHFSIGTTTAKTNAANQALGALSHYLDEKEKENP